MFSLEIKKITEHDVVFVPAATKHNFINSGSIDLKLFAVYAAPKHPAGTINNTKNDAEAEEHGV